MFSYLKNVRDTVRKEGEYRLGRRGTFLNRFAVSRPSLVLKLCMFPEHYSLLAFGLWVRLGTPRREPEDGMESWGVSAYPLNERYAAFTWGRRYKSFKFPWALEWCKTENMGTDGRYAVVESQTRAGRAYLKGDGTMRVARWRKKGTLKTREEVREHSADHSHEFLAHQFTRPYSYTLKSGDVQIRSAAVTATRMTWTWRLPYVLGLYPAAKVSTSIHVTFSDEVGERTGSWKGGVTGCGYEILPGESLDGCLARMTRDRKFD